MTADAGGLQAIAELLQVDNDVSGNTQHVYNITMRRYACMALTNLTFADAANKALLCSMLSALRALVAQLGSVSEDLCQVAASVLRNLSWHSDLASKRALRDVEAAMALVRAAMVKRRRESTLKSVLSALWNLSSHSPDNKADICLVPGALEFFVSLLSYRSPSKTLSVIENAGGILRNVSSHVAVRDDFRAVLRRAGCLQTLLRHLRSPSLTVVSNACGTLWNLSARCVEDQSTLLQLGAVPMLKNLVHSRHRMISMGSAAALKNLLTAAASLPCERSATLLERVTLPRGSTDSISVPASTSSSSSLPVGLHVRRQRAFEDELNRRQLSETCDDLWDCSPTTSPTSTLHRSVPPNSTMFDDSGSSHRRRVQSPSPLRLTDRSAFTPRQPLQQPYRSLSSGHAGMLTSHSSDEISLAWTDQRTAQTMDAQSVGLRRPTDWWPPSSCRDGAEETGDLQAQAAINRSRCGQMMSSFSDQLAQRSPTSPLPFSDGAGSRRFLKSRATNSTATSSQPSAAGLCASFLSERTESIHLADLEFKSSFDAAATCGRSTSCLVDSATADNDGDELQPTNRRSNLSDVAALRVSDSTDASNIAATATAADSVQTSNNVESSVTELGSDRRRQNDCTIFYAGLINVDFGGDRTSSASSSLDDVLVNTDKAMGVNPSPQCSDVVSDIMAESFPNLTQFANSSDLQSSTELDRLPTVNSTTRPESAIITASADKTIDDFDSLNKEQTNCSSILEFDEVERLRDDVDIDNVLCYNSAELVTLLEVNANRVLRELELKTADSISSCSEPRLLEDETISLVSGHNDCSELDFDDDDDDDDYIDAISSRTYDISSASGEAAGLSSRHCSSRSSSSGSESRHSTPPAPVKSAVPGRPRIVKPNDNVEDRQNKPREVKSVRGRRKALYSSARPKITPAAGQSTSSGVRSRLATDVAKRANSATTTSRKQLAAVVRPVTGSKPTTSANNNNNNNGTAKNAGPKRVMSAPSTSVPSSRLKPSQQATAAKKPGTTATTTQSKDVADSRTKRRSEVVAQHSRSDSTASRKSTTSNHSTRPSSASNQSTERPTAPGKQTPFVRADEQSTEEIINNAKILQTDTATAQSCQVETSAATERRASGVTAGNRPSSASSTRSNKPPPVSARQAATAGSSATATSRVAAAAASKMALRHSSPSATTRRTNTTTIVRTPQPSPPTTRKASSSLSAASAAGRGVRSFSAASPVGSVRKPAGSSQSLPLSPARSSVDAFKKPAQSADSADAVTVDTTVDAAAAAVSCPLTRTSTYDKLVDKQDKCSDGAEDSNSAAESTSPSVGADKTVEPPPPPAETNAEAAAVVVDIGQLSEVVIRRARQLVEQADQIQTRYVSPPQSIRFSGAEPTPADIIHDVIQRPAERHVTSRESSSETTGVTSSSAAAQLQAAGRSPTADKHTKSSPVRKFGFMGLWRRPRSDQQAPAAEKHEETKNRTSENGEAEAGASTRRPRKTFSWWRRNTSSSRNKTLTDDNTEPARQRSVQSAAGRLVGTSDTVQPPRTASACRAAVVTPFNYRPTITSSASPSLFADLPPSHQTKTAMLIERRMRRLKLVAEAAAAAEADSQAPTDCCKTKQQQQQQQAEVKTATTASRRKNLLVTTV